MSRQDFLQICQLDLCNASDQHLYTQMQREASTAVQRMIAEGSYPTISLDSDISDNPIPMTEYDMRLEILRVRELASPETKEVYVRSEPEGSEPVDNWAIRWLILHEARRVSGGVEMGRSGRE